jgi:peptidoglycan/xylan/chitin deacetylase (PgdA/CDA1 family)
MDPDSPFRMLSSNSVKEMADSGLIEFGAHTHSHPVLSRLSKDESFQEIESSIKHVERFSGRPCDVFAYPFGGRFDYTQETVDLLKKIGIRAAVTTIPGFNDRHTSTMELRRYSAGPNENMSVFQVKVHHVRRWTSKVNRH